MILFFSLLFYQDSLGIVQTLAKMTSAHFFEPETVGKVPRAVEFDCPQGLKDAVHFIVKELKQVDPESSSLCAPSGTPITWELGIPTSTCSSSLTAVHELCSWTAQGQGPGTGTALIICICTSQQHSKGKEYFKFSYTHLIAPPSQTKLVPRPSGSLRASPKDRKFSANLPTSKQVG